MKKRRGSSSSEGEDLNGDHIITFVIKGGNIRPTTVCRGFDRAKFIVRLQEAFGHLVLGAGKVVPALSFPVFLLLAVV